jgi:hypothetical protein
MDRLQRWFAPPSPESPAETLRWVRRVSIGVGTFVFFTIGITWAAGDAPPRFLLVSLGLFVLSAGTLGPGAGPDLPSAARGGARKRRGRRAGHVFAGILCVTFPIVGYAIDGLPGAIFFLVVAVVSGGLGLWLTNRMLSP